MSEIQISKRLMRSHPTNMAPLLFSFIVQIIARHTDERLMRGTTPYQDFIGTNNVPGVSQTDTGVPGREIGSISRGVEVNRARTSEEEFSEFGGCVEAN